MTRTERTYYSVFGLYCLAAFSISPVYPLFLASRGLDLFQVNVVLATYLIVVFLFEVPTGAVADLVGRKASFLLSCVIRAFAYALYAFTEDFGDCLVAETIDAIGTTLATGALDAWAVDGRRSEGTTGGTDAFFARAQLVARIGMIAGGVACGYLADEAFVLPWFACAGIFLATGALGAATMREERLPGAASWKAAARALPRTIVEGGVIVRRQPVLLLLCTLTLAVFFAALPLHLLWQPRVQALTGEGHWLLGWLWAFFNLAPIAGSIVLPRLLAWRSRELVLAAASLWRAATIGVTAAATSLFPLLGGFFLQEVALGVSEPVFQAWTNEHVSSERRATVLSVRSMFATLGGALGLVGIGLVARAHGIGAAWGCSAVLFVLIAPGFLWLGRLAAPGSADPGSPTPEMPAVITKAVPPPAS